MLIAVFLTHLSCSHRFFRLRFQNSEHRGVPVEGYSIEFMVTPFKMKIAATTLGDGDYTETSFPKTLRLGGTPGVDSLPAVLKVGLLDNNGTLLTSANCLSCMTVTLIKCDSSSPVLGTTDGSTAATAFPSCGTGVHNTTVVQSGDQTNAYSQAKCTQINGICDWWWVGGHRQTLSTSVSTISGIDVNVVNGVATFNNLQILYTFGAGFRLRFVYNYAYVADNNGNIASYHTAVHTNIFFPDIGSHVTADVKSFIILPFRLDILQHPGGDGVDIDSATGTPGDGYVDTPDGAGRDLPFRVQPAVAVKGKHSGGEYYFTDNRGEHGHAPVTAVIRSATCGAACVSDGLVMSGTTTGVSLTKNIGTPVVQNQTDEWATFSGTTSVERVELRWMPEAQLVGFLWKDLKITTKDAQTAAEGLRMEIMTGFNTSSVAASGTTYTTVTTGPFDIFIAPDPPMNVRILGYGPLGYRIDFDPAKIFRTKPLSGFIIEIDRCAQSGQTTGSCALQVIEAFDSRATVAPRALGSDYYSGGGRAEEVQLTYDPTTSSSPTAVTITMYPVDYINENENITFTISSPGVFISTTAGACIPTGTHGGHVNVTLDTIKSTVLLTVRPGFFFMPKQPAVITLPTSCGVIYPNTNPANYDSNATVPDATVAANQIWRYGRTVFPTPLKYAVAYVVGPIMGDNCKGAGCNVTGATQVLPTIQDSVRLDAIRLLRASCASVTVCLCGLCLWSVCFMCNCWYASACVRHCCIKHGTSLCVLLQMSLLHELGSTVT